MPGASLRRVKPDIVGRKKRYRKYGECIAGHKGKIADDEPKDTQRKKSLQIGFLLGTFLDSPGNTW